MTRVAAVDCGTNTVRLLVADIDATTGAQHSLARELRIVRLGEGVDRTGRLSEEALSRLFSAVDEYAAMIAEHRVHALRFVATSAVRDASNVGVFADGIRTRLGVLPEVVSGAKEAELTYAGATRSLPDLPSPVVVLDIGGGSTELIVGDPGTSGLQAGRSLDIGSVRLTERLMPSDPPTRPEVEAAAGAVDAALDSLPAYGVHVGDAPTLVGVAGTVTTLASILLRLTTWDPGRVHHSSFPAADVHELAARVVAMSVAEREKLGVPRGRSDVIGAGAVILDRVLHRSGADRLTVSDSDILDGVAWSVA